jgi:imidazolonepropionase-like amidohydrolase
MAESGARAAILLVERNPPTERGTIMKKHWTALLAAAGLALLALGVSWSGAGGARPEAVPGGADRAADRATALPSTTGGQTVAITGVRLFDGERFVPETTVIIADGMVTAVGQGLAVPGGAAVVAGAGRTLLPGLIDAHTHSWGTALERAAVFGVTTQIDMFTAPAFLAQAQREQAEGRADGRADLVSAGILATAPGGHGTQFGIPVEPLTAPEQAPGWVDARLAEGSDFIKVVIEDGHLFGRDLPTLSPATVRAVIAAAHARDRQAVTHVHTLEGARQALAAGTDGLAHLFLDEAADAAFVRSAVAGGLFVIPTMTVLESATGTPSGQSLITDPRLADYLTSAEIAALSRSFPATGLSLDVPLSTVRALHAAGVPIVAGSDAPNPGTTHGASLHRELELLVQAGLSPTAALAAATSVAADAFGLTDRGRVTVGRRADLLLVDGDPSLDVTASRAIVGVWKAGVAIERRAISAEERAAAAELRAAGLPTLAAGTISTFDTAVSATHGFGWQVSTDSLRGGSSSGEIDWIADGAAGDGGALRMRGEIRPGAGFPWSGAMYFAGPAPMEPVALTGIRSLSFDVRGAGASSEGSFQLLLFASSLGPIPAQHSFEVGAQWRRVEVDLTAIPNLDLAAFQAFLISADPAAGAFELHIDNVAFE